LIKEMGYSGQVLVYGKDLRMLFRWMQSHQMFSKMAGWAFCVVANVWLLNLRSHGRNDLRWDPSQVTARDRTDVLLLPLAMACWVHTTAFFGTFLFEFEKLGIFYKTVFTMLYSDVANWILLFIIFFLNYGMVMYIVYPRFAHSPADIAILNVSGVDLSDPTAIPAGLLRYHGMEISEPAGKMMQITSAFQALIELAFIGEPLEFDLTSVYTLSDSSGRTSMKTFLFIFFYIFYIYYIVMSLILLLNLLIAMMGDTYASSMEQSTLGWRVAFARRVLRLELQLQVFHKCGCISLHCGEKVDTGKGKGGVKYVYPFKTYQANAEGGGTRGATRSMFDEGIEEEAEEDEKDDDGPGANGDGVGTANVVKIIGSAKDLAAQHAEKGSARRLALNAKLASKTAALQGAGDGKVGGGRSGFKAMKIVGASVMMIDAADTGISSNGAALRAPSPPQDAEEIETLDG